MAGSHHDSAGEPFAGAQRQIANNIARLKKAVALTAAFFFVELIAGFLTNSLALISDAGHMLSDILAITLSLYAASVSRKAPTVQKSFGYYRTEVLAALFNGLVLFLMFGFIYWEAFHRLLQPVPVQSVGVIIVGATGLGINLIAAWILRNPKDLNTKGAYYHVILDAFGSVAALISGILIYLTNRNGFDSLLSMVIGVLVLYGAWILIRDSVNILMESVPKHLDPLAIRAHVLNCDGVENIHDLHIWSIGSNAHALSAHIKIPPQHDAHQVRTRVEELLRKEFQLDHTTLQVESIEECVESHD